MTVFDAIKQYPNAFIHMAQDIDGTSGRYQSAPQGNKIGINPQKIHNDPPGIYFYYNRWLLSSDLSENQYAINYENYWICDIKQTPKSINLSTVKWNQIVDIATRNGWKDELNDAMDVIIKKRLPNTHISLPKNTRTNGAKLWFAMKYIATITKKFTWLQLLKDVDVIFDPGEGIINTDEPAQAIVLNKNIIKILLHGSNKDKTNEVIASVIKSIAEQYGGKFYYQFKQPIANIEIDNKPISIRHSPNTEKTFIGSFDDGFWIEKPIEKIYSNIGKNQFKQIIINYSTHISDKADKNGHKSKWNINLLQHILNSIFKAGLLCRISVENNILNISTGWNGWGHFNHSVTFFINKNDDLKISINFNYELPNFFIKIENNFLSTSSPEDIITEMRDKIKENISKTSEIKSIHSFYKIIGFKE